MPTLPAGLSPKQQRRAAAAAPSHSPQQPHPWEYHDQDDYDSCEEEAEDMSAGGGAAADAAAEAAAEELLLQEQAEKQAEEEKAAKAAAKKAAKKKVGRNYLHPHLSWTASHLPSIMPLKLLLKCCIGHHLCCVWSPVLLHLYVRTVVEGPVKQCVPQM